METWRDGAAMGHRENFAEIHQEVLPLLTE